MYIENSKQNIMERKTRVAVFESEKQSDIQLIKSKLEAENISTFLNDNYMSFMSTPTANTIRLLVNLQDEQKAFAVIDETIKKMDSNILQN